MVTDRNTKLLLQTGQLQRLAELHKLGLVDRSQRNEASKIINAIEKDLGGNLNRELKAVKKILSTQTPVEKTT